MRPIICRYANTCEACGADLAVGAHAIYERGCGIYCPGCAPTDPEVIRALRQARNERKAQRREEWAAARQRRADALEARSAQFRGDWAFTTQPGHIPARARSIAAQDRAAQEQAAANAHRGKAAALRAAVAVAGDAAKRRDKHNAAAKARLLAAGLRRGSLVVAEPFQGERRVLRCSEKSVTVEGFATSLGGPPQPLRVAYSDILDLLQH